jgi:hypothetical protein
MACDARYAESPTSGEVPRSVGRRRSCQIRKRAALGLFRQLRGRASHHSGVLGASLDGAGDSAGDGEGRDDRARLRGPVLVGIMAIRLSGDRVQLLGLTWAIGHRSPLLARVAHDQLGDGASQSRPIRELEPKS